jgi:hypothetical protein
MLMELPYAGGRVPARQGVACFKLNISPVRSLGSLAPLPPRGLQTAKFELCFDFNKKAQSLAVQGQPALWGP